MLRHILCSLALVALLPEAQALDFYHSDATLVARGRINTGDAGRFEAELTDDVHSLQIRSEGGEVMEGLAIAELVAAHGLRVTVDGYCVSACAQYIFPAGMQHEVLPGGALIWTGAGPAMVDAWLEQVERVRQHGAPYQRLYSRLYTRVAEAEQFRQRIGAFNLLHNMSQQGIRNLDAVLAVKPDNILIVPDEGDRSFSMDYVHPPRCQVWLPDASGLAEIGVSVPGYVPPDVEAVAARMGVAESEIYQGSLFNTRRIKTQCDASIKASTRDAGASTVKEGRT
jgi:hypothetical protein